MFQLEKNASLISKFRSFLNFSFLFTKMRLLSFKFSFNYLDFTLKFSCSCQYKSNWFLIYCFFFFFENRTDSSFHWKMDSIHFHNTIKLISNSWKVKQSWESYTHRQWISCLYFALGFLFCFISRNFYLLFTLKVISEFSIEFTDQNSYEIPFSKHINTYTHQK